MNLTELLSTLRRFWVVVLLTVLGGLLAAGAYVYLAPRQYSATTLLYVSAAGASDATSLAQGTVFVQSQIRSYPPIVTTSPVLDAVSAQLRSETGNGPSQAELSDRVSAEVPQDSTLLRLTVRAADPDGANRLASAFATAVSDEITRLETPEGATGSSASAVRIQRTDQPSGSSGPGAAPILAAGGLLGLLAGVAVALALDRRRRQRTVPEHP